MQNYMNTRLKRKSKKNYFKYLFYLLLVYLGMNFNDLLATAVGQLGNFYRQVVSGDQAVGNRDNRVFQPKVGKAYAVNKQGFQIPNELLGDNFTPISPMAEQPVTPVAPKPRLDVERYQGGSSTPVPQPNQLLTELLFKYLPDEATSSAVKIAGENAGYNPSPNPNLNSDGTYDYGLGQINTKTFNDLMGKGKYRKQLANYGIRSLDDVMANTEKGVQAFQVARQYEKDAGAPNGSWWYGWQNKGYTIDPNKKIEEIAKDPAYFKLREFVRNR